MVDKFSNWENSCRAAVYSGDNFLVVEVVNYSSTIVQVNSITIIISNGKQFQEITNLIELKGLHNPNGSMN